MPVQGLAAIVAVFDCHAAHFIAAERYSQLVLLTAGGKFMNYEQ